MKDTNLIQLKTTEVQEFRDKLLQEQNNRCKICNKEITENSGIALDHQHRFSKEPIGENGAGLIRGVLCRNCNLLEGKIWNQSRRFGISNKQDLVQWLHSLIDYLESDPTNYIHPSEKPKRPLLKKREYNKLCKILDEKNLKKPAYTKYLTKEIAEKFEKYYPETLQNLDI